jgi:hypothetical protein
MLVSSLASECSKVTVWVRLLWLAGADELKQLSEGAPYCTATLMERLKEAQNSQQHEASVPVSAGASRQGYSHKLSSI